MTQDPKSLMKCWWQLYYFNTMNTHRKDEMDKPNITYFFFFLVHPHTHTFVTGMKSYIQAIKHISSFILPGRTAQAWNFHLLACFAYSFIRVSISLKTLSMSQEVSIICWVWGDVLFSKSMQFQTDVLKTQPVQARSNGILSFTRIQCHKIGFTLSNQGIGYISCQ